MLRFSILAIVSVPYEITLLSNTYSVSQDSNGVSVPYEITLLSNHYADYITGR